MQAAKAGEASLMEAQQLRLEGQRLQDRSDETQKKLLRLAADMQQSIHVIAAIPTARFCGSLPPLGNAVNATGWGNGEQRICSMSWGRDNLFGLSKPCFSFSSCG